MTTELSLEVKKHLAYPPERVFDAWLDPKTLAKFMKPGPDVTTPEVTSDAVVGGRFKIVMKAPEMGEIPHEGEYLEIDRPNRLKFTWLSPYSQEGSTVTLTFASKDGGTDLTLHHIRFPSEESRDNHEGGWTAILNTLSEAL